MVLIYDIVGNRYKKGFNANLLRRQAMGFDFLVQSAKFEYNQSAQMDKNQYHRQRLDRQLIHNRWEK